MTFATVEASVSSGRPVELLQLAYSMTQWFYTSAEVPITFNSNVYTPLPIKRDVIQANGDATKATLGIAVPHDTPVGELFRIRPPSEVVTVTLYAEHYLDNDFQVLWKGRVTAADWQTPWLNLSTESVFSSLNRIGLRRRYSTQCGHVLYGRGCNLARESFKTLGTVSVIAGAVVTIPAIAAFPASQFAGGYMEWTNNVTGAIERLMITASGSGTVTFPSAPVGLAVGMSVQLFDGCDHNINTCNVHFNNALNYGGMPYIPLKNPFAGSAIY